MVGVVGNWKQIHSDRKNEFWGVPKGVLDAGILPSSYLVALEGT